MSGNILEVDDLTVSFDTYEGRHHVLDGVDLTVGEGETVALVGETGCGKSVTARSIMGTLPRPPGDITAGQIRYRGTDLLTDADAHERVKGDEMSMIFQDPMTYLSPVYPVGSMMADVATYSGGKSASWWEVLKNLLGRRDNREEIRERSAELLERMRIPDPEGTLDRYPVELSGGMRQRVIVAMALINDPEFLIADEPTTALDVTVQNQILDLLRERVEERNLSMLYITHNLGGRPGDSGPHLHHVRRRNRGGWAHGGDIRRAAPPVHARPARQHPEAHGLRRHRHRRPDSGLHRPALGLPVPPAVPRGDGGNLRRRTGRGLPDRRRPDGRVPPLRGRHGVRGRRGHRRRRGDVQRRRGGYGAGGSRDRREPMSADTPDGTELDSDAANATADGAVHRADEPAAEPLVSVRDLRKYYPVSEGVIRRSKSHVKAVDGVSFDVFPGETFAVVGESGCGKTTLRKTVARLYGATSGTIAFDGRDVTDLQGKELRRLRRDVQVVYQDPSSSLNPGGASGTS